jgi:NAD(P)H dehydrogenase (quinone)
VAEAEKAGIEKAGGKADIYLYMFTFPAPYVLWLTFTLISVPETLPQEVLTKMGAPPKANFPEISVAILPTYDAFLFGIPTRYGMMPAQWKVYGH